MENVIHREMCKKLKFSHTTKCYMHNPESVLENETQKILWDFERRLEQMIVNKKKRRNLPNIGLCSLSRPQSENQNKRKERKRINRDKELT